MYSDGRSREQEVIPTSLPMGLLAQAALPWSSSSSLELLISQMEAEGGELMGVAFLMRCDNACPLCPTGCDWLDSASVAEMMQGEKIIGVSVVCGPAATHSPQDMLYPAFIPFMSTNEKSCMAFALIICMHLPAFT